MAAECANHSAKWAGRTTCSDFTQFSVRYVWLGDISYVASGFVDDVMFSHNGAMWKNQSHNIMFGRVRQVAEPVGVHAIRNRGEVCYPLLPCYYLFNLQTRL